MARQSTGPSDWGWKLVDNTLEPIDTLLLPAPERLLNTIFCNCKKGCSVLIAEASLAPMLNQIQ